MTNPQAAAVATMERRRRGISSAIPPSIVYVNTAAGDDNDNGLTSGTAKATLAAAAILLTRGGTIYVTAGSSTPLREMHQHVLAFDVSIEATTPGTPYYWHASVQYTSGWSAVGGGVYSRSSPAAAVYTLAVPTLTDAYGLWLRLARNTSTPTTPAAGEFGVSSGTLYVHLPSSANPNSHTLEVSHLDACVKASVSASTLTLVDSIFRLGNTATVWANGGNIEATDCVAQYGSPLAGSWATSGSYSEMRCTDCIGEGSYNDGFNHHAATGVESLMVLTNCEGRYNDDEGASPHDDCVFTVSGGRYHHNSDGGITCVNRAVIDIDGATVDFNNEGGYHSNWGGIAALDFSGGVVSGSITNCVIQNNDGPGLYLAAGHSVTHSGNTSGTAAGNSDPDTT